MTTTRDPSEISIERARRAVSDDRILSLVFVLLTLSLFLLYPLLGHRLGMRVLLDATLTAALIVMALAVVRMRGHLGLVLALAVPALVTPWISRLQPGLVPAGVLSVLMVAFLGVGLWGVLLRTFASGRITMHRIAGALTGYVLFGLIWAFLYAAIELRAPGAFHIGNVTVGEGATEVDRMREMLYFSFVTLTTLGYGDITPVSQGTRMLTVCEAFVGQLYLVVLVARLVSLEVVDAARSRDD